MSFRYEKQDLATEAGVSKSTVERLEAGALELHPPGRLVDAVWALTSPEVYSYLTEGQGWSLSDAEAWLVDRPAAAIVRGGR